MRLKDKELFRQLGLIGGEWIAGASGEVVDVIDPANQAVLGTVPDMGTAETRAAIEAANAAFGPWKKKTHAERAAVLERWHALMIENLEDLAVLVTMEQGKPLEEARGEIRYGAAFVKWFAEESRRIGGHTIPSPTSDRRIVVLKEAVGVCAIVTPWNFPNAMITRKVARRSPPAARWSSSPRSSRPSRRSPSACSPSAPAFRPASSISSRACRRRSVTSS